VVEATDLYKVPDAVPPIHADKVHSIDGGKFRSIFNDNLQPISTRGKKARSTLLVDQHCGNGCSIKRAPPPLVITTKLAAAILVVPLFGGGALPGQYYSCGRSFISRVTWTLPACQCSLCLYDYTGVFTVFSIGICVKQGDSLSLALFNLFIYVVISINKSGFGCRVQQTWLHFVRWWHYITEPYCVGVAISVCYTSVVVIYVCCSMQKKFHCIAFGKTAMCMNQSVQLQCRSWCDYVNSYHQIPAWMNEWMNGFIGIKTNWYTKVKKHLHVSNTCMYYLFIQFIRSQLEIVKNNKDQINE